MAKIKGDSITLQDIADIYQPQTIASVDLTEDGYLVYGANGVIGKYHLYNHEKEQICITCRGNTCGTVNFTAPKSWITGNAMVINTDNFAKNVNKRYLYHYLSSINFNLSSSPFLQSSSKTMSSSIRAGVALAGRILSQIST